MAPQANRRNSVREGKLNSREAKGRHDTTKVVKDFAMYFLWKRVVMWIEVGSIPECT